MRLPLLAGACLLPLLRAALPRAGVWPERARPVALVAFVRVPEDDLLALPAFVLPERGLVVAVFATLARYLTFTCVSRVTRAGGPIRRAGGTTAHDT